jgi:hypothetical protein
MNGDQVIKSIWDEGKRVKSIQLNPEEESQVLE